MCPVGLKLFQGLLVKLSHIVLPECPPKPGQARVMLQQGEHLHLNELAEGVLGHKQMIHNPLEFVEFV